MIKLFRLFAFYFTVITPFLFSQQIGNTSQTIIINSVGFIDDGNVVNDSELSSNISGYFEILDNEIHKYNIYVYGTNYTNINGGNLEVTESETYYYKRVKHVTNEIIYNSFRVENGVIIFPSGFSLRDSHSFSHYYRSEIDMIEDEETGITTYIYGEWQLDLSPEHSGHLTGLSFNPNHGFFHVFKTPINWDGNYYPYDGEVFYNLSSRENENSVDPLELVFFSENSDANNLGTDSDGDGLYDYHETGTGIYVSKQNTGSDPNDIDSDDDGITDGIEVNQYNTNPNLVDSDGDTLNDGAELFTHNTNPNLADTNSDGINDDISLEYSIDPNGDYSNIINYISTNPENLNLYTQIQVTSAEANARTQGREDVISSPNDYSLYSQAAYDAMVAERDARPTQVDYDAMVAERDASPTQVDYDAIVAERDARPTQVDYDAMVAERDARPTQVDYDAMVAERDARPTQVDYDAMVAERDARPTQAAYDAVVAERDARPTQAAYDSIVLERDSRPTQENYDSLSQELATLNNRVYDVLPKLTPARPIFDYPTINLYFSEAKQEIDNSREYSLTYKQIEDDITSLDGYIMVLENGINQSDLENANGLLDDIISNIESSDLSVKVSYDFSTAKVKFQLAKIYLSIGDLNSTYNRVEEAKQEIENSRSFDTTYQSIDSEIAIFENALLQEDLDTAHDALEDIIYDLEYSEFASNVQYDFSIAESKFKLIDDEISSYWQDLDNYDPTPVPSETLENYIIGLNQEIEDAQIIIDQKFYVDEFKDLRPGSTMIEVSGNQATVQLQMEESSDLESWQNSGTPASMTIPAETNTKFFRFKMAD